MSLPANFLNFYTIRHSPTLKMEAASSSKILVTISNTAQHQNPENYSLNTHKILSNICLLGPTAYRQNGPILNEPYVVVYMCMIYNCMDLVSVLDSEQISLVFLLHSYMEEHTFLY